MKAEIDHALRPGLGWLRVDQPQHAIPDMLVSSVCSHPIFFRAPSLGPQPSENREQNLKD